MNGRPPRPATVSNLCFHGIGAPDRELELDEERYWVGEEQFAELLDVAARYPRLCLTFDDGNASDVEIALPALQRRGLRASFFVIAGRIGTRGSLDAAAVRALADAGMTVGSHGLRHRPWRSLDAAAAHEELVDARAAVAAAAGAAVQEASCPFGAYDRRVLRRARDAGFTRVYTVDEAPARPDAWLQGRYTILSSHSGASIERLGQGLDGSGPQQALRAARSAVKRWR
jgi:peptidoglycan/xylan/chitin deacetylase (PgdA/CDA1 family)